MRAVALTVHGKLRNYRAAMELRKPSDDHDVGRNRDEQRSNEYGLPAALSRLSTAETIAL